MMSIFVSSLADLTAGIAFQPVIYRFAGVHKPDLDDNTVVNVAVGIADLLQIRRNAFFSRLTAVDAHIPAVMKRCRVYRPDVHFSHFIQCHGLLLSALIASACILQIKRQAHRKALTEFRAVQNIAVHPSQIFDDSALIQRFQLLQNHYGRPAKAMHMFQQKMCGLIRLFINVGGERRGNQRGAEEITRVVLKNHHRADTADLCTHNRIEVRQIDVSAPVLPVFPQWLHLPNLKFYILPPIRPRLPEAGNSPGGSLRSCLIGI